MIPIRVKRGHTPKIKGKPSLELDYLGPPTHVAVLPGRIPFIKPRVSVEVGQHVKIGSVLCADKRNPDVKFLSPGGGKIEQIALGPRRSVKEIVVKLDEEEGYETFDTLSDAALETIEKKTLIQTIQAGGLWGLIRELPFRDIAGCEHEPPAIIVSLGAKEPFHPEPIIYLNGKRSLFESGLKLLKRLSENVYISVSDENAFVLKAFKGLITHTVIGDYPADDPGVLLYHTKKTASENHAWYINGQDLLLLATLVQTGKYPTERTIVLAGSSTGNPRHLQTRMGVPLRHIVQGQWQKNKTRFIVGGIFRGYTGSPESYLGFYETSLTLIPEGKEREVLGFVRPGFGKQSYSRTFLSSLNSGELKVNCNLHGGDRACIACGYCVEVCPVDMLPQLTFKSTQAGEVEESLEHGLLDCVECGLCSYVCPSKIELTGAMKKAKAAYYKELA